ARGGAGIRHLGVGRGLRLRRSDQVGAAVQPRLFGPGARRSRLDSRSYQGRREDRGWTAAPTKAGRAGGAARRPLPPRAARTGIIRASNQQEIDVRLRPGRAEEALQTANAERVYRVTRADLPLHCPLPSMYLWNSHPKVYLPIEATGKAKCPYCSATYRLVDEGS